jgi:hypothetical protein
MEVSSRNITSILNGGGICEVAELDENQINRNQIKPKRLEVVCHGSISLPLV